VVLYGCETWSLILREEHRLRVFENRVLKRIFGPKRDEVVVVVVYLTTLFQQLRLKRDEVTGWRKLHNEELHCLYSSSNIIRVTKARRMRWAGHLARMGEVMGAYNILVGGLKGGDH
jgi:hypothetical protein